MSPLTFTVTLFLSIGLNTSGKLLWNGNFNKGWEDNWNIDQQGDFGQNNRKSVSDPFGYFTDNVLQVTYPQNTYGTKSGTGFYARPLGEIYKNNTLCIQYFVAFASNFQWVIGGKLPGLFGDEGGASNDNVSCHGNLEPNGTNCFNTRMMWREMGAGEVYGYVLQPHEGSSSCTTNKTLYPSSQQYCTVDCKAGNGESIGRGMFYFNKISYNQITQQIEMNTINKIDGKVDVWYNGVHRISFDKMEYRTNNSLQVVGIDFSSFFGGTTSNFKTPVTTTAYFANFSLFSDCMDMLPAPICDFDCNGRGVCIDNDECKCYDEGSINGDLCSCQYCNKYNIFMNTVIKKCWATQTAGWLLDIQIKNHNTTVIKSIEFLLDFPQNVSISSIYGGLAPLKQINFTTWQTKLTHTIQPHADFQFTAIKTYPQLNPLIIVTNVEF